MTCALLAEGTVRCWGDNLLGQLGDGTTVSHPHPTEVLGLTGARGLAVGGDHACALLEDGGVKCWGYGLFGGLGFVGPDKCTINEAQCSTIARQVPELSDAVQIGIGGHCALLADGRVKCWAMGWNSEGQWTGGTRTPNVVPELSSVARLAVGGWCAVLHDGSVNCWGDNGNGQRGYPFAVCDSPGYDACITTPTPVPGVASALDVVSTGHHVCARRVDGRILCWGSNDLGELGMESDSICVGGGRTCGTPRVVPGVEHVSDLALGLRHTCALADDGSVKCWGDNTWGQLGDGKSTPWPWLRTVIGPEPLSAKVDELRP